MIKFSYFLLIFTSIQSFAFDFRLDYGGVVGKPVSTIDSAGLEEMTKVNQENLNIKNDLTRNNGRKGFIYTLKNDQEIPIKSQVLKVMDGQVVLTQVGVNMDGEFYLPEQVVAGKDYILSLDSKKFMCAEKFSIPTKPTKGFQLKIECKNTLRVIAGE